jgi:CDP-diacylglycerol--glycerol-3-phosphate 3-phosphatidyltransferase
VSSATALLSLLGVLALCFVSMGVYALLGGRHDKDAVTRGSQFLMGRGDFFVHWFMWVLSPLDRLALRLRLTPDFFNFAGLFFGGLSGALIASGQLEWGGWAIILGGVADIMDGRIARSLGVASDYGKFIDATLDRFVEVFALLGFVFFLMPLRFGPILAATALAGSLLVSYTRARGESVGVLCKEGLMQRAERLVLMSLVCLGDGALTSRLGQPRGSAALSVLGLIAVGTLWTAAHRTIWIARRLRERERAAR